MMAHRSKPEGAIAQFLLLGADCPWQNQPWCFLAERPESARFGKFSETKIRLASTRP